ncbi:SHOCT domain-containing protein (plasmid) [Synechocystis sp. B12]|nr:SHOCT domain-containing protein [Synechocystis sp. B12]
MDKLERLEKLKAMLDQGAISQQEYETMKAEVIANQPSMPQATAPSATYGEPEKSIRTGVGWQEVVAVLGGLIGGIVYAFATKQKAGKKAVVFGLGVLMSIISTIALGDGEKATTSSSSDTTTEQVETSTTENSAPANDPQLIQMAGKFPSIPGEMSEAIDQSKSAVVKLQISLIPATSLWSH